MIDAFEAGLFLYWITSDNIIAVEAPSLAIRDNRLHNEAGPAVEWPAGEAYYFWRGLQIPAEFIARRESVTVDQIMAERNAEHRRVRIELFGRERFLREADAHIVSADTYGTLWRVPIKGDEPWCLVEVENATVEHGHRRKFFLRVPPDMKTAHQAVAWTFHRTPETYAPEIET